MRISLCLFFVLGAAACTGSDGGPGVAPACFDVEGRQYGPCRVFRGRLQLPQAGQLHSFARYFQIAAVGFVPDESAAPTTNDGGAASATDAGPGPADRATARFFLGPTFAHEEGAGQRPDMPFSVVAPCELAVNLVLQVPRGSGGEPGLLVAPMEFAGEEGGALGTLIPGQSADACGGKTNSHDLEKVVLTLQQAGVLSSGQIILGKDTSKNPLALLDTDGDGTDNLADADDDDDGRPDLTDADADADGILDSAQMLSALPDSDKDGVPDPFE